MADRPLILFSRPHTAEKERRFGGAQKFNMPTHGRQVERLQPQFGALQDALERGRISISQSPDAIEPEYTLVLEVAGIPRDLTRLFVT